MLINKSPLVAKKYTVEERSSEKYKKAIREEIKSSKRIYFRLISAHTMFYDDIEKFIPQLLEEEFTIKKLEEKDVKIQLLDRATVCFNERARNFVGSLNKKNMTFSCEEYLYRCRTIIERLERLFGKEKITYYQRKYLWRLLIFDDKIFMSAYFDKPGLIEGHLTPAYAFSREFDPVIFDGFLEEFNSLYKKAYTTPPTTQPVSVS
jgi:hypothetical protein